MTRIKSTILPSTPSPGVERPALRHLLETALTHRVCLVIGAAGWGKTTAVAAMTTQAPTVCIALDGPAGHGTRLVSRVIEALRDQVSAPLEDLPSLWTNADARLPEQVAAICRWVDAGLRQDLLLILDDLHELPPDSAASRLIEALCRQAPPRLHLVLVSRAEPPFSLERLRGQGLVAEIDARQLALGVAEIAACLRATIGEDAVDLAARVREWSGGWPAATWRVAEAIREAPGDQRERVLRQLTRPGERFHGYLVEEVLGPESETVRELMRRLAVLGEVSPVTRPALGIDGAENLLADLTRRGLVRYTAMHDEHWSLVPPIRDVVNSQLPPSPAERVTLHRSAAGMGIEHGSYGDALRHLLVAGDHDACVAVLHAHGSALVNSGQVAAILEAAELPSGYLDDPKVQEVLGHARHVWGQWASARECFRLASDNTDELEPALAWRMALVAFAQAEFSEVLVLCDNARLDGENLADEARLLALAASAYRMVGDYPRCRASVVRAMAAAERCEDPGARAAGHAVLGMLAVAEGDRRRADAHRASGLAAAEAGDDLVQAVRIRIQWVSQLVELGEAREALTEAETVLRIGEARGDPNVRGHALTVRGKANTRLGNLERAFSDFTAARDLFQGLGSRYLAWPLCGLGDTYRMRGQLARARAVYEEALALAKPCPDVVGLGSALIGLARVRAADDVTAARELADQAVTLGEGLRHVQALLTRGWVALVAGDRDAAASDAAEAAAAARSRRDDPGLAEALTLTVMASPEPVKNSALLNEAIQIWHETGCVVEEAQARLVAARIHGDRERSAADHAVSTLAEHGVNLETRAAGPLGVLARSAPVVSIRTLGVFQVLRDGTPIPKTAWQSKKARDLLKILVARRGPVPRSQLMELLWPEADPGRAGNRLSVLLSAVRDVVQPGVEHPARGPVVTDDGAVWLDRSQVEIDVDEFLTAATLALEAHAKDQPDAIPQLEAAENRLVGDFLADDPYQDWAAPLGEEVRAAHIALLRALISRLRDDGDVSRAVRYTLRLLQRDGYDEQAHLDLVRIHLDAGHHGEARRHYRTYLARMAELGVEPQPFPQVIHRQRAAG